MCTRTIIDLNNQTLAYLQDQDFAHAIESSTCAMGIFKPVVDCCVSSTIIECVDHCILRSSPVGQQAHSQPFIYKQGIPLPRDTTDLRMCSQILIFNSALAHQMFAEANHQSHQQQQRDASLGLLYKARRLYQLANSQGAVEVNVLFHFVIMNNIAVIDRTLGRNMLSKISFCYLQAKYLLLMHQGDSERLRHLQGFRVNLRLSWRNHIWQSEKMKSITLLYTWIDDMRGRWQATRLLLFHNPSFLHDAS